MSILGAVLGKNHALRADSDVPANPDMLNQALRRLVPLAKHDCLICVISDATGVNEESERLVTQLNAHNDVLAALIFDPLEAELPSAGRLVISDGQGQLEVDTAKPGLRQQFKRDFELRLNRMRELSRKQAIPLLPLSTAEPVAEQLRAQLGYQPRGRRV